MKQEYHPAFKFRNTMGHGKMPQSLTAAACVRPAAFKKDAAFFVKEE
jgi:hypothetical protein